MYRTYLRSFQIEQRDRDLIEATLSLARSRTNREEVSDAAFEFMRRVLLLEPPYYSRQFRDKWLSVVMRWQQFSGPVMAKGLEDTAFYAYNALLSLNEVGGDPLRAKPPYDAAALHQMHAERQRDWPDTMNCTSTHDTKRSEDVRARINVLSEMPQVYHAAVSRWMALNESKRQRIGGQPVPAPSQEILIYQSLLGAWPLYDEEVPEFRERFQGYVRKCAREAKEYTSWTRPNNEHESALLAFADSLFDPLKGKAFREDFLPLQRELAHYGAINALAQVLLKATAPGLPDIYQGMEMWNFSLVDPDNRRPVDFRSRTKLLEELKHRDAEDVDALLSEIGRQWKDGRIKLFTTYKTLEFRRENAEMFSRGRYLPLRVKGERAANLFAFAREDQGAWCVVAVPYQICGAARPAEGLHDPAWWTGTDLVLPAEMPHRWQNVFTQAVLAAKPGPEGESRIPATVLFQGFPVALLESVEEEISAR